MKKLVLSLALLLVSQSAFAYLEEYTTSDTKTLQTKGYSQAALEIVDTTRMLTQGTERDYVPYFSRKFYSDVYPIKWYQMAKRYFDPAQDEHIFGVREYQYSNGWFDSSPSYNKMLTPNDKYTRLHEKNINRLETAGKTVKGSNGVEQAGSNDDYYYVENL